MRIVIFISLFICFAQAEDLQPFFKKYCTECHNADKSKGEIRLDMEAYWMKSSTLPKIIQVLKEGEMPPKKKKRVEGPVLEQALKSLASKAMIKERQVRFSHLTVESYNHTINDLFRLNLELGRFFMKGEGGESFDNNSSHHSLNKYKFNDFLSAAEFVTEKIILPAKTPQAQKYTFSGRNILCAGNSRQHDGKTANLLSSSLNQSVAFPRRFSTSDPGSYKVSVKANSVSREAQLKVVSGKLGDPYGLQEIRTLSLTEKVTEFNFVSKLQEEKNILFLFSDGPKGRVDRKSGNVHKIQLHEVNIEGPFYDGYPTPEMRELIFIKEDETLNEILAHLRSLAAKLFGKPVAPIEIQMYTELAANEFRETGDALRTVRTAAAAILCSPHFLYKLKSPQLNQSELAARLSYFLWDSGPDRKLLKADIAAAGLHSEALRMLEDQRTERFVGKFVSQWLRTDMVGEVVPDKKYRKLYNSDVERSIRQEPIEFFKHLLKENLSADNFIDSQFVVIDAQLSKLYRIPITHKSFAKTALDKKSVRGGLLGQAAIHLITSNGTETSPIHRGVWILKTILGETLEPPANVPALEPDIRGALSLMDVVNKHKKDESCNRCHEKIDPLGMSMENFTLIGQWRDKYEPRSPNAIGGVKIHSSLSYKDEVTIDKIHGLKTFLLKHKSKFHLSLAEKLMSYALERNLSYPEKVGIEKLVEKWQQGGGGLKSLLLEIIQSSSFRHR